MGILKDLSRGLQRGFAEGIREIPTLMEQQRLRALQRQEEDRQFSRRFIEEELRSGMRSGFVDPVVAGQLGFREEQQAALRGSIGLRTVQDAMDVTSQVFSLYENSYTNMVSPEDTEGFFRSKQSEELIPIDPKNEPKLNSDLNVYFKNINTLEGRLNRQLEHAEDAGDSEGATAIREALDQISKAKELHRDNSTRRHLSRLGREDLDVMLAGVNQVDNLAVLMDHAATMQGSMARAGLTQGQQRLYEQAIFQRFASIASNPDGAYNKESALAEVDKYVTDDATKDLLKTRIAATFDLHSRGEYDKTLAKMLDKAQTPDAIARAYAYGRKYNLIEEGGEELYFSLSQDAIDKEEKAFRIEVYTQAQGMANRYAENVKGAYGIVQRGVSAADQQAAIYQERGLTPSGPASIGEVLEGYNQYEKKPSAFLRDAASAVSLGRPEQGTRYKLKNKAEALGLPFVDYLAGINVQQINSNTNDMAGITKMVNGYAFLSLPEKQQVMERTNQIISMHPELEERVSQQELEPIFTEKGFRQDVYADVDPSAYSNQERSFLDQLIKDAVLAERAGDNIDEIHQDVLDVLKKKEELGAIPLGRAAQLWRDYLNRYNEISGQPIADSEEEEDVSMQAPARALQPITRRGRAQALAGAASGGPRASALQDEVLRNTINIGPSSPIRMGANRGVGSNPVTDQTFVSARVPSRQRSFSRMAQ